jgi:hypothetical protein
MTQVLGQPSIIAPNAEARLHDEKDEMTCEIVGRESSI